MEQAIYYDAVTEHVTMRQAVRSGEWQGGAGSERTAVAAACYPFSARRSNNNNDDNDNNN